MILAIGNDLYLICIDRLIDRANFLARAKVKPGSYAEELISDLHYHIFHRSLDLAGDYKNYYRVEYSEFSEYLRRRFRFSSEIVKSANEQFSRDCCVILFEPSHCFIEGEYGIKFLECLLQSPIL